LWNESLFEDWLIKEREKGTAIKRNISVVHKKAVQTLVLPIVWD